MPNWVMNGDICVAVLVWGDHANAISLSLCCVGGNRASDVRAVSTCFQATSPDALLVGLKARGCRTRMPMDSAQILNAADWNPFSGSIVSSEKNPNLHTTCRSRTSITVALRLSASRAMVSQLLKRSMMTKAYQTESPLPIFLTSIA